MKFSKQLCCACLMIILIGCDDSGITAGLVTPPEPVTIDRAALQLKTIRAEEVLVEQQERIAQYAESRCSVASYAASEDVSSSEVVLTSAPASSASMSDANESADTSDFTFTDTNNQEMGVHEADDIKVRHEHAYVKTTQGIDVYQLWPAEEFQRVASLEISGTPTSLLASDEYLIVLSSDGFADVAPISSTQKLSYSYGEYYNVYDGTRVTVFDLANPAEPRLIRTTLYEGSLQASRRRDGQLLLVMSQTLSNSRSITVYDDCNVSRIATMEYKDVFPRVQYDDARPQSFITADDVLRVGQGRHHTLLSMMNISLATGDETVETMYGFAATIYASEKYIVAANGYQVSELHAFTWSDETVDYVSTGAVPGKLLNQFALSEYEEVLRVVAGRDYRSHSVYALDLRADQLPILSQVDDIGKNEKLYAVRFMGDKGYAVTFKKVDPLYVLDLSDPTDIRVTGELKIPGYSTYLHPMSTTHLIGIGNDTVEANDPNRDFAWFQGIKLSIFDVSDPTDPRESHKTIVGGRGTTSSALHDHRAFTYDAHRQLLAMPITLYDQSATQANRSGKYQYTGMQLYSVDAQSGLELSYEYTQGSVDRAVILGDAETTYVLLKSGDMLVLQPVR